MSREILIREITDGKEIERWMPLDEALKGVTITPGNSTVKVNHNTGGPDMLRIVDDHGNGIENANIYVYLKDDWDNGLRNSAYCKRWSMTDGDGRWSWSVFLEPGIYYFIIDSPGYEQQQLKEVEVL